MKPASFGILFSMIFLCFSTISDYRTASLQEIALQQIMYNNCLDNAIEDAMTEIVEVDEGRQLRLNREKAVEDFFSSLTVNFGVMENPQSRELLKAYVPAIAFIERNRITFFYDFLSGGKQKEAQFYLEKGDYQIYFTLRDYVYVKNQRTGEELEGDFHDVAQMFQIPVLQKEDYFYEEQKRIVREVFIQNMEEIIENHNETARRLGIKYHFFLPVVKEEWYRGIEKTSMMVFFQGYPYGNGTAGYYNRMAVGGAEIKKREE